MSSSELRSFPPADDAIDFIKQVDWHDVRVRFRNGIKNLLLVAMVVSEKSYDFHAYLAEKLDDTPSDEPEDAGEIPAIPSIWKSEDTRKIDVF